MILKNAGISKGKSPVFPQPVKVIALDRELLVRGISKEALAAEWGVRTSQLAGESRLRLLCENDERTHKAAREASDGLEHGTLSSSEVAQRALTCKDRLVGYVRKNILSLGDVEQTVFDTITAPPYDIPLLPAKILAFSANLNDNVTLEDVKGADYAILDLNETAATARYNASNDSYEVSITSAGKANVSSAVTGLFFRPSPSNSIAPDISVMLQRQEEGSGNG